MRFGSSNVVYRRLLNSDINDANYEVATYKGVAKKTLFYLLMTVIGAACGIALAFYAPTLLVILLVGSGLFTFILSLISIFSVSACKVTGSLYCFFEGFLVGFISLIASAVAKGAVTIALLSTIAVFAVVATLFVSNVVKVSGKFVRFLIIFSISFLLSQLIFWIVASIAKFDVGIGITLLVSVITVFLATLYLFFDLENVRQVVESGYPKKYEWYTAFGLAFTLIWLYVEILRIVIVLTNNRN